MRRELEVIRQILLCVGANRGTVTSRKIAEDIGRAADTELVDYQIRLLVDIGAMSGRAPHHEVGPGGDSDEWQDLSLTWVGNDLLDLAENESRWNKVRKALGSGGRFLLSVGLKTATSELGRELAQRVAEQLEVDREKEVLGQETKSSGTQT